MDRTEVVARALVDADLHMHTRMECLPVNEDAAHDIAQDIVAALDAVRSPQGEGHEAGIEAATRAMCSLTGFGPHYGGEHRVMAERAITAYLSRCPSPERDSRGARDCEDCGQLHTPPVYRQGAGCPYRESGHPADRRDVVWPGPEWGLPKADNEA